MSSHIWSSSYLITLWERIVQEPNTSLTVALKHGRMIRRLLHSGRGAYQAIDNLIRGALLEDKLGRVETCPVIYLSQSSTSTVGLRSSTDAVDICIRAALYIVLSSCVES